MDGYFSFDSSVIYPLPASTSSTAILQAADPTIYAVATFFKQILNTNLEPVFSQAALANNLNHANLDNWVDNVAVAQTITFPLDKTLLTTIDFKFPLLNIYEEDAKFDQLTLTNSAIRRNLIVQWILPPLTAKQYNNIYPFFQLAAKAVLGYGQQGYDPKVNPNGPSIWKTAGLSFGFMYGYKLKKLAGIFKAFSVQDQRIQAYFPSIEFKLSFEEKNQLPVLQNFNTKFTEVILTENLVDGYNPANPINNFIDGYIFPDISLTSCTPGSGTINGQTLLVIEGTGFNAAKFKSPLQLTICGSPVIKLVVKSPTVIQAITNPGINGTSGTPGDIVLTDNDGNVATLTNGYTYL